MEGLRHDRKGRTRQLVRTAIHARAEPHRVWLAVKKLYNSPKAALEGLLRDGMTIMSGGFGLSGNPESLISEITAAGVKDLTIISNNAGADGFGLGTFWQTRQVRKMISSYVGENKLFEKQYLTGELELELNPQGTLAERIRAGGAGIPAFYTATGVGTVVADGKPQEELKVSTSAKLGSVPISQSSRRGAPTLKAIFSSGKTARNFNPVMATAAKTTVVEVEELVDCGEIDPDCVHTPGIYVRRIVKSTINEKRVEKLTVRVREA